MIIPKDEQRRPKFDFVVLFGAGASYANENLNPRIPLGRDLYDRVRNRPSFSELDTHVKAVFEAQGFEAGMRAAYAADKVILVHLQKDIAAYLLSLDHETPTLYDQIVAALPGHGLWSTLNYECLLESAILRQFQVFHYLQPGSDHTHAVAKLHGSANFSLGGLTVHGVGFNWLGQSAIADGPIEPMTLHKARLKWADRTEALGPAMSLFMEGKDDLIGPRALAAGRQLWAHAVASTPTVVCVGVHIHAQDRHIWEVIGRTRAKVAFVGPEETETYQWAQAMGRARIFHLSKKFDSEAISQIAKFVADRA